MQVSEVMPQYTSKDLSIVKTMNIEKGVEKVSHEVRANRDFGAYELMLSPNCTEYKTSFWSRIKAVMTQHGPTISPDKKNIVLDGRLRQTYPGGDDASKCFCLFFLVDRSNEKQECNMDLAWSSTTCDVKVKVPTAGNKTHTHSVQWKASDLIQLPVMVNPKAIKKGTKIVCCADRQLLQWEQTIMAEKAAADSQEKKEAQP